MYGEGISKEGETVDLGVELDIVQKSGSWYAYGDERLGQGRENAKQYLKENTAVLEDIANKIRASYGIAASSYTIAHDDEEEMDEELMLLLEEE